MLLSFLVPPPLLSPPCLAPVPSFTSLFITGSGELSEGAGQLQQPSIDRGHSHCPDQAAASAQQGIQPLSIHLQPQKNATTLFHYCCIFSHTSVQFLERFYLVYLQLLVWDRRIVCAYFIDVSQFHQEFFTIADWPFSVQVHFFKTLHTVSTIEVNVD